MSGPLAAFQIQVALDCDCDCAEKTDGSTSDECCCKTASSAMSVEGDQAHAFVASARAVQFLHDSHFTSTKDRSLSLVAIFVPPSVSSLITERFADSDRASTGGKTGSKIYRSKRKQRNRQECAREEVKEEEADSEQSEMDVKNERLHSFGPQHTSGCLRWIGEGITTREVLFKEFLSQVHPSLTDLTVRGVISACKKTGSFEFSLPAEVLLLEIPRQSDRSVTLHKLLDAINGEGMLVAPHAVIKCLPLSSVSFLGKATVASRLSVSSLSADTGARDNAQFVEGDELSYAGGLPEIPPCPVCLHRIDPQRLGLPKPKNQHLCSQFCAVSDLSTSPAGGRESGCRNQQFLSPWPQPSYCKTCQIICEHRNGAQRGPRVNHTERGITRASTSTTASLDQSATRWTAEGPQIDSGSTEYEGNLLCYKCGMRETLWVCLTCGVVGCGRYSNLHAVEHFKESGHPFSLELVTLRIWEYATGEYAERGDVIKCPSMSRAGPLSTSGGENHQSLAGSNEWVSPSVSSRGDEHSFDNQGNNAQNFPSLYSDDASPKKATMIGEEYEALLQSALEDQAQHYEGEISRLRAALTAQEVDEGTMTDKEMSEIERLKTDIASLRAEADQLGTLLLDGQAQEAGYRATSQRLLREQAIAKGLLDKITEDAAREHESGKLQVEDLEQQVADLTANLSMRDQIAQDRELSNAQIFGTTSVSTKTPKRGKKSRRWFRK